MNDINFGFIDEAKKQETLKIQKLEMDLLPHEPFKSAEAALEDLYTIIDVKINQMELEVRDFRVSQKNYNNAEEYKKQIMALVKAVNEKKAELKAPHLDYNRSIDDFVKKTVGRLNAMKAAISTKMLPVLKKIEDKNKAAEEKAKATSKRVEKREIRGKKKEVKTHTRKVPQWEVVDESKVPRKYMTLDTVKINKDVRAGKLKIAGLKIWIEEKVI